MWGYTRYTEKRIILAPGPLDGLDSAPLGDRASRLPRFLVEQAIASNSVAELQIRLKAIQAAFLNRGNLLVLNSFADGATQGVTRSFTYLRYVTNQLNLLSDPTAACFASLAIVTGGHRASLKEIRLSDVDCNAGSVRLGITRYLLPESVFRFVHAQRILRDTEGASPDESLGPAKPTGGAIGKAILRATKLAKVTVPTSDYAPTEPTTEIMINTRLLDVGPSHEL